MRPHVVKDVVFSEAQIAARINALACDIAGGAGEEPWTMVGILRGSFIFLADLVRALHRHGARTRIDFMVLGSYGSGVESSGRVRMDRDITLDPSGAKILLVDDILDTGRTLAFAVRHLQERGADSVRTCVLLDKPARRVVPFHADYVGFTVPDEFMVGYGLDYDHAYREMPWIGRVTFTEPGAS
jgi:hypoxanthine phosphoribosyltransferase